MEGEKRHETKWQTDLGKDSIVFPSFNGQSRAFVKVEHGKENAFSPSNFFQLLQSDPPFNVDLCKMSSHECSDRDQDLKIMEEHARHLFGLNLLTKFS